MFARLLVAPPLSWMQLCREASENVVAAILPRYMLKRGRLNHIIAILTHIIAQKRCSRKIFGEKIVKFCTQLFRAGL